MKKILLPFLSALALVTTVGCQSMPQQEFQEAQAALARADSAEADVYAPITYTAALDSFAAATAEIEAQDAASAFSRNYDGAIHLLAVTIDAAQEAEAEALHAKVEIGAEADSLISLAQETLAASPDVMKQTGSTTAATLLQDAATAHELGDYMTARDLARQALQALMQPAQSETAPRI